MISKFKEDHIKQMLTINAIQQKDSLEKMTTMVQVMMDGLQQKVVEVMKGVVGQTVRDAMEVYEKKTGEREKMRGRTATRVEERKKEESKVRRGITQMARDKSQQRR